MVDNTLFTKKKSSNLIIVQIYVDDIIFDSTCQDMCDEFAKIMHDEFEMSMMGELNFFLGLQIKQMEDGIFFNQSKYIKEMLKKFGLEESKPMKTPMSSDTKLTKDEECESVDSTKYRGMIDVDVLLGAELIYRVLRLQVLFLELDQFGILLGEREEGQGASCTSRKVSYVSFVFSILFVLSRGGSMSPDTFLPSILLLVVIIVTVVVKVVVVVVVAGGVPSIIKHSFVIIGSLHRTML
ncbi:retrovirus-related pol polyprotein from transposon TNT 1-94 [Tanacetum coccineum]